MNTQAPTSSEKALPSNADGQVQQSNSEIDKLLIANTTLVIWLIFLAIGGGILALYYSSIHYLPDIEWKAALIYLFIASMVGGVMGLLLTLSLYLPGIIWADFIIFDAGLNGRLSYEPGKKKSGNDSLPQEPCVRSIILHLGIPFFIALLASHIGLLVIRSSESEEGALYSFWCIALVLLVVTFFVMRKIFGRLLGLTSNHSETEPKSLVIAVKNFLKETFKVDKPDNKISQRFKYSFWFSLSVFLNQISMYVIYRLAEQPDRFGFALLTMMCTTGVCVACLTVALRHRVHPKQAIVASLVIAGILLFAADRFSSLSTQLMGHFGFGASQKVSVLLNAHGTDVVNQLGIEQCDLHRLCNVEILSKIGKEYFLKVRKDTYITLDKADIVAVKRIGELEVGPD